MKHIALNDSPKNTALPLFPDFEEIRLDHKRSIESITSNFPAYSDFNFTNLWIWNVDGTTAVSSLNNNLLVKVMNYNAHHLVLTLDGDNKIPETIDTMLDYCESHADINNGLEYVHEYIAKQLEKDSGYHIVEEPHNFDYIVHLPSEVNLRTRRNKSRRKQIQILESDYGELLRACQLDISQRHIQEEILSVFDIWATNKNVSAQDIDDERIALSRLFDAAKVCRFQTTGVYKENELIGFTIDELVSKTFALGHIMKAKAGYKGIFQYLEHQASLNLIGHGAEYINLEQDLGIENLRIAKLGHHPIELWKKFTISRKN